MQLTTIDWAIILAVIAVAVGVGAAVARQAGKNASQFFLSGRSMSGVWLGISIVATTFAADTPGLVTEFVRQDGIAGNWRWWALLLTGMLTVFLYARLWRRSGVTTDLEFYELRYSGPPAAALRAFRAIYLGVVFNVIVMAIVSLAAIKIGQVMFGFTPIQVLLWGGLSTLLFSTTGGFRAVILTDCILFVVAIGGAVAAAYFAVNHPDVGGLANLLTHERVVGKLNLVPAWDWSNPDARESLLMVFIIPLSVQWWSMWYPSAEPGGGGYLAQRMLAAKNENHAVGAVMLFNAVHYAIRPWPWILVALASLVVFPTVTDLGIAFPDIAQDKLGNDLAYPAMLTFASEGWQGLIVASLLAAYMSTISTHLNWGSSYVVNDFYQRFIEPNASDRNLVRVGRVSTIIMMLLASLLALWLNTAEQGFTILLQVGAGTGLIYILRWYWWRINAYAEIVAMVISFAIALFFQWSPDLLSDSQQLCAGVLITTCCWMLTIMLTPAESRETLESFCRLIRPAGPGWAKVYRDAEQAGQPITGPGPGESLPLGILRMVLGCIGIYAALFAVGYALFGNTMVCITLGSVSLVAALLLLATYRRQPARSTPS
ncbi:sodium:solute symporter family protein [Aeoliella mucimassa]|uniref:Sodium/glucose cotransporter n=1 Tax=Aeoliella mucimassa TaxID=2527972 RepID=A0A518ARM3_9BACT|nr:sodium:solute symporter family protein [Aeoliella mucimassa]QDU57364.1 Sodium/glucose cotransporter [Aeoliella mucimassa]